METKTVAKAGLFGGAAAAIVASVCCFAPLVLVTLGMGGAWLSNLTALEAYRPVFIVLALGFMALAYRHIFMVPAAAPACVPGTLCAAPATNRLYKALFWVVSGLVLFALAFPYFLPIFY